MITSLVFSLITFFIISTTTVLIISNRIKIKNERAARSKTENQIQATASSQAKNLSTMASDLTFEQNKINHEIRKNKQEFETKNKKLDTKVDNVDKRLGSFQGITTANLMGMNNRFTTEFQRVDEDIRGKSRQESDYQFSSSNTSILGRIAQNKTAQNLKNTEFKVEQSNIRDLLTTTIQGIAQAKEDADEVVIGNITMSQSARDTLSNNVMGRYDNTNRALGKFFGDSLGNSNDDFVLNQNSYTGTTKPFDLWFGSYYDLGTEGGEYNGTRTNLTQGPRVMFDKLDASITDINDLQGDIDNQNLWNTTTINSISNIHRDYVSKNSIEEGRYLINHFSNEHEIDLVNLNSTISGIQETIAGVKTNSDLVSTLTDNYDQLNTALKGIGVIDINGDANDGTPISLSDLSASIQENSNSIAKNQTLITTKLDAFESNNFNSKIDGLFNQTLGSNLPSYYETITSNLDMDALRKKISDSDDNIQWSFGQLNSSKLLVNTEIMTPSITVDTLQNIKYKQDDVDKTLRDELDRIDQTRVLNTWFNDVDTDDHIDVEPIFNFSNADLGDNEGPDVLNLKDGMDLVMGQPIYGLNGSTSVVTTPAANLYVSGWENIIAKSDSSPEETLYSKMSNIERRLNFNSNEIHVINNGRMSKSSLKDIINTVTPEGNFFSIKNLVTGCDDPAGCPTVDARLTDQKTELGILSNLVSGNETDPVKFTNRMKTFGINKDVEQRKMSFFTEDGMFYDLHAKGLTLNDNLSVDKEIKTSNLDATTATIQNDLNVNTNAYMKNATIQGDGYLNVPGFDHIRTTEKKLLPAYLNDNYVRKDASNLTNAVLTSNKNSSTLTIYNQANDVPIEVHIPRVSAEDVQQSATDLVELKNKQIFNVTTLDDNTKISRRIEFSSNLNDTSSPRGYIPNKWSFIRSNNEGDWVYQTGEYEGGNNNGNFDDSPLPFHKDRSDVIEALGTGVDKNENSVEFKNVVIGEICLKANKLDNDDVLQVCNKNCDTSCTPVWTHKQAPVPRSQQ